MCVTQSLVMQVTEYTFDTAVWRQKVAISNSSSNGGTTYLTKENATRAIDWELPA
jgi:hypothetical protein